MKQLMLALGCTLLSTAVLATEQPTNGNVIATADKYVVYTNGKRDHRAELRLLQMEMQYKQPSYGRYATDRTKREFDYRLKRKIDKEVDRLMAKIF
jgi:hypothetical protein